VKVEEPKYAFEGGGPEYETLGSLGSMCLIDNLNAVAYAGHLCNQYGMDTIGVGCTIAFAMEAFEKGVITEKDTGGIKLTWGNAEAMVEMVELMGQKKGLGELLGQGTRRAAQRLGKGSEHYAVNVKGMEVPMHDPRAFFPWLSIMPRDLAGPAIYRAFPISLNWGSFSPKQESNTYRGALIKMAKVSLPGLLNVPVR
jgi:aldehyde:ferredoxin oxidoreductase